MKLGILETGEPPAGVKERFGDYPSMFRRLFGEGAYDYATFDVAGGWGGNHGWGPAFVLTHQVPDGWPRPDSTVHFVTDGLVSAVDQAKAAAGGKSVGVHGADTIQQLLNAGLLDELAIDLAPVLLGSGVRLFEHLDAPQALGDPRVTTAAGVTHLRYPVRSA